MWTSRGSRSIASGFSVVMAASMLYTAAAHARGAEDQPKAQVPVQLPVAPTMADAAAKIQFDVSGFTPEGLFGPAGGLRSLAYEFCIPANEDLADEVRRIDPSVQVFAGSPGRIGCTSDQYLCIGNTHQPGFQDVLLNLAGLEYVARIEPSFGE